MKTPSVGQQHRYLKDELAMLSAFEAAPCIGTAGCWIGFLLGIRLCLFACVALLHPVIVSAQRLPRCNKLLAAVASPLPCSKVVSLIWSLDLSNLLTELSESNGRARGLTLQ